LIITIKDVSRMIENKIANVKSKHFILVLIQQLYWLANAMNISKFI